MPQTNIKIERVNIHLLKPALYNPRVMDAKQESDLTASLKQFGIIDPIIANSNKDRLNIVIGGHQRLKIALKLGYKEIPVVYLDLSEEKEKILNLRLNKNTGSWDLELLKNFEIGTLLDVGFDTEEIGMIWNDVLEIEDDAFDETKELENIKTTDIKPGDLFALGNHKLLCADSTKAESTKTLMGNEKAQMIYTDSPYNIKLDYNKGLGGKKNYGGHVNDAKSDSEFREFLKQTMLNAIAFSQPDVHFFYYCDQKSIGLIQSLYSELGIKNQRVCLWIKNGFNVTPQVAFNKCYEPCVYGIIGKPYLAPINNLNEILNKEIGTGNRTIDDIMDGLDIWLAKRLPGQDYEHATSKPPTLHEKALRRCTRINDIVLDLFGGSGSTLIACEQLKRRAYLVEKENIFCQLIINRFEKLTGLKARLLNKSK
jgi:DNA modification methylase